MTIVAAALWVGTASIFVPDGSASAAPTAVYHRQASGGAVASVRSHFDRRTMTLTTTPGEGYRTIYDSVGHVTSRQSVPSSIRESVVHIRPGESAEEVPVRTATDNFACFDTGPKGGNNFLIFPPIRYLPTDLWGSNPSGDLTGEYIWQRYLVGDARRLPDGDSFVLISCTVGSWKTNNGYQQDKSGVALEAPTFPDSGDRLLSGANPGRQDGGSITSNATIQATWGPVSVGASLPLTGTGTYTGNFGSREADLAPASFDQSPQNEVNAWWHDGSLILPGTNDPVNETNEGLWEQSASDFNSIDLWFASGYHYNCPNFNCG